MVRVSALAVTIFTAILLLGLTGAIISEISSQSDKKSSVSTVDAAKPQVGTESSTRNVTFRLLAVERHFAFVNGTNFYMKSAQHLIGNLTTFKNWTNCTWGGVNYKSYIRLLSADPAATTSKYYRGQPTNSNVVSQIQNFLGQTGPGESNNQTVRIFYYCGHTYSGYAEDSVYMQLDQTLYDYQLNATLMSGDLATNNCTLVILDSCHSKAYLDNLKRPGRVVWTACGYSVVRPYQLAHGWGPDLDPPGRVGWFTGSKNAKYKKLGVEYVFGPVGIVGGLYNAKQIVNDGWRSAEEIFDFAWNSTIEYAKCKYSSQQPYYDNGVVRGGIPIVMYQQHLDIWNPITEMKMTIETPFFNNAPRCTGGPPPSDRWETFHGGAPRTGFTMSFGANNTAQSVSIPLTNPIESSPAIADGLIIIGTSAGPDPPGIHALNMITGEKLWSFQTQNSVISSPTVKDGLVYFGTDTPGKLYAVHELTGVQYWVYEFPTDAQVLSSPAIADGLVFIGIMANPGDCGVYALNQTTGEPKWFCPTLGPIRCSPAVANGRVYAGTVGGGGGGSCIFYAINELTGTIAWQLPLPTDQAVISTPAVADNRIFFGTQGTGGGKVYALYETSGTSAWPAPFTAPQSITSSPAVDSGNARVIVGCQDGRICCLNEADGAPLWDYMTGSIDMSSPAISGNGLVYIGSTTGILYCLNETTGAYKWSYALGAPTRSSPAIAENHVFIGCQNGNLYTLGPAWPIYDIAVTDLTVSPTLLYTGNVINIDYTVRNEGNVAQTFNITIACNNTAIANSIPWIEPTNIHNETLSLQAGSTMEKTFAWNTLDTAPDTYNIIVQVDLPPETYETDTQDNAQISGTIRIKIAGDINGDQKVNVSDLQTFGKAYGSTTASPNWNPEADINRDLIVNQQDLKILNKNYGKNA